ncbi:MAG: 4-hydroxyphenylpyruvate dioxygenase, partial [Spirulinaceae cyanobacterium RM2_2_10]|nr:4-hydroxyphenylpyruvate dioxygenase [Spirulinaceae cyanobacterium RM2_2_10]
MQIARVQFVVEAVPTWRNWFVQVLGCQVVGDRHTDDTEIAIVVSGRAEFWLTAPRSDRSPAAAYLGTHPPGVADVTFAVEDVAATLDRALHCGAKLLQPPNAAGTEARLLSPAGLQHTLPRRRYLAAPLS